MDAPTRFARLRRPLSFVTLGTFMGLVAWIGFVGADEVLKPSKATAERMTTKRGGKTGEVEIRFLDDSKVKMTLRDERLELATPYGHLGIPIADIQRIDFATRTSEELLRRIDNAVANLGSPQFQLREEASADLLQLREKGYQAILRAAKLKDPEVTRRAEQLIEKIRESVSEDMLEVRRQDVIYTADSKISGQIETAVLKATTFQFGEVQMRVADMRGLRTLGSEPDGEAPGIELGPVNLVHLQAQVGKKFTFKVTGALQGSVWGTDTYSSDSSLAVAAVHAGLLRPGQSGNVKVAIVAPPAAFVGSVRNGVSSANHGNYPGAFQILR